MYCSECGEHNETDAQFCIECGNHFTESQLNATSTPGSKPPVLVEQKTEDGGFFSLEKKGINMGVKGGILMIIIAVVWFFGALAAGWIFYYPPILGVIGVYAVIKGLATGNIQGDELKK